MPMAGAARDLAAAFEFEFTNGFVFDTTSQGPALFRPLSIIFTPCKGPNGSVVFLSSMEHHPRKYCFI